jgi:hypothetical protein
MKQLAMIGFVCVMTQTALGQSFNLDIGQPGAAPSNAYAGAANQPGHWLSLPGTQGVTVFNLVDINGNATNARLSQIGGTQTLLVNDPDVTGDDAILMNDFLITFSTIENCLFFNDMQPGEYEVFIYARMPAQPEVFGYTSVDQEPGVPHHQVGGAWPGHHEEFISYSHHTAIVAASGPTAGRLYMHSGVVPGGDLQNGAALNGVQIRKLPPPSPGDVNGDNVVNVIDLLAVIANWGPCSNPNDCPADIAPPGPPQGDDVVNVQDLLMVINNWG